MLTRLREIQLGEFVRQPPIKEFNSSNGSAKCGSDAVLFFRFYPLADNCLTGKIPTEFGMLTNLECLFLGKAISVYYLQCD
jgi:hypothetical protein